MTKRQRFVLSSLSLAFGFFIIQFAGFEERYLAIGVLTLLSLFLAALSLREGLGKDASLLTLILPTFFTAGIGLFYFLLPSTLLTRIPVLILYAVGIYALLLTSNIFTVGTIRTIALVRAAHAVGFLLTLVTSFLLFDTVLSLRSNFLVNALAIGFISFPLLLSGFWSIELERSLGKEVLQMAAALSLIAAQIAIALSFWPVSVAVGSLALTTVLYVALGLGQAKLQQRLFEKTIKEYLLVGIVVFVTMFLTARWGG